MDSANANKDIFTWTDSEVELLLECIKSFASNCIFEGKDWEGIKSKYEKIRSIFVEQYPKPDSNTNNTEDYPKFASLDSVTEERISGKIKSLRLKYKKAVDLNKTSGGGRLAMTFYDLCSEIWGGAPATNSIQGAIASSTFRDDVESEESFQSSGESPITEEITCERRDRIARFLQDEPEKRIIPKMSFEKQQLKYMKENMEFKKRVAERGEETDKELLSEAKK
eukprot:gene10319-11390_t